MILQLSKYGVLGSLALMNGEEFLNNIEVSQILHYLAHNFTFSLLSRFYIIYSLLDGNGSRHASDISRGLAYRHHGKKFLLCFAEQLKLSFLFTEFGCTHIVLSLGLN